MKEKFVNKVFRGKARVMIGQANEIIEEYAAQGLTLTLRQLYYQFVIKNLFENKESNYDRLGTNLTNGRLAGLIDWDAIEDRERNTVEWLINESQQKALKHVEYGLAHDMWQPQDTYVEVWVEKVALSGVIREPCRELKVPYLPCKGYLSASTAYLAGKRFQHHSEMGKKCVLIHLGDHDPSGMDMTRDNASRLRMFARDNDIEVRREALNMDQVRKYNPPPNPAKQTDRRFRAYQEEFGNESWELDALSPDVMRKIITDAVSKYIDQDVWDETLEAQTEKRKELSLLYKGWPDVRKFMAKDHNIFDLLRESSEVLAVLNDSNDDEGYDDVSELIGRLDRAVK